jgi:hypothetical protein
MMVNAALMTLVLLFLVVSTLLVNVMMQMHALMMLVMKALENAILSLETVMTMMLVQLILV